MTINSQKSGIEYFLQGFQLIQTKGIRRFVFIPLLVNLILFSVAFYYLFGEMEAMFSGEYQYFPSWLNWGIEVMFDWFDWLLWPLAILIVLVFFSFIFGSLANWISAPFNGLLSEKIEQHLTGQSLESEDALAILKDIPRTLGREFTKLTYYIPRAIGFLIIFFLLPLFGQIIWFLFTAWSMAVQYCDYPFDNHKVPFSTMRQSLSNDKKHSFSFGIMVTFFSMVPVVNFLVMPVAICGATSMWVDRYKKQHG